VSTVESARSTASKPNKLPLVGFALRWKSTAGDDEQPHFEVDLQIDRRGRHVRVVEAQGIRKGAFDQHVQGVRVMNLASRTVSIAGEQQRRLVVG
jgi:hypothetical protein